MKICISDIFNKKGVEKMENQREHMLDIIDKAVSNPGSILYIPDENGLGFLTAVENEKDFILAKHYFENAGSDAYNPYNLHVYIEDDILFLSLGGLMTADYTFGLKDTDLIKRSLYVQDKFKFTLLYMNNKEIDTAKKNFVFSDRHKEVIKSYIAKTYSKDVNLKDKYGESYPFKTERESQMSFLNDTLDSKTISPNSVSPNDDVLEYISKKYDIKSIDRKNESLMNQILDYVLAKYIINSLMLGYCVHEKCKPL